MLLFQNDDFRVFRGVEFFIKAFCVVLRDTSLFINGFFLIGVMLALIFDGCAIGYLIFSLAPPSTTTFLVKIYAAYFR